MIGGDPIKNVLVRITNRLKHLFPKVKKRSKQKIKKLPKNTVNQRFARWLFLGLLIFVVLSGPIAFIKSNNVSSRNAELTKQIKSYQGQLDDAKSGSTAYNPLLGEFMQKFASAYMNVSPSQEEQKEAVDKLASLSADGLEVNQLISSADNTWVALKDSTVTGLYVLDNTKIAQLRVNYQISAEQTKQVKDKKGKSHEEKSTNTTDKTAYLNVPYASKNGKFIVVAYPFISDAKDPVGKISEPVKRNESEPTLSDGKTSDRVTTFTKDFLAKYVVSSSEDMSFMMAEPVGLNGAYDLVSVDSIRVTGTTQKPVVAGVMTLKLKDTPVQHQEQFILYLNKQKDTYFVDKMGH